MKRTIRFRIRSLIYSAHDRARGRYFAARQEGRLTLTEVEERFVLSAAAWLWGWFCDPPDRWVRRAWMHARALVYVHVRLPMRELVSAAKDQVLAQLRPFRRPVSR